VPVDQLSDATAQQCFALLTAERALIEFVTGPEIRSKSGVPTKVYSDDICPKCFVTNWYLSEQHRDHLRGHRSRINKHLSYLTWSQTVPRQWHTTPITLVVEAFADFNKSLAQERPRVSSVLTAALDTVIPAVERLRQAQTPQLLEHALSAEAPSVASIVSTVSRRRRLLRLRQVCNGGCRCPN
jgi:glutathione S-transferase